MVVWTRAPPDMGGKPSVGAWGDGGGGVGVAGEVVQVYKCTSHTMNAQTTQQHGSAARDAKDNSPWLRSTRCNELVIIM